MPMPCKMMTAMLALALPVAPAQACQPPAQAETQAASCTEPLTIINRADSFIITRRSYAETQPSPRPASFLRLPAQRLGNNVWFDSDMLHANQPLPALPLEDQEQSK